MRVQEHLQPDASRFAVLADAPPNSVPVDSGATGQPEAHPAWRSTDVDLVRAVFYVRGTLMPVQRFTDEPYRMVEGPPKTNAGDRAIPIPRWLCDEISALLATRGMHDRDGFLFTTRYGNPLNRDHFREQVIRPALRAAGLP